MRAEQLFDDKPQARLEAGAVPGPQGGQAVPSGQKGSGINPGGIEAIKQTIALLLQRGVELQQIVDMIVGMLQTKGIPFPPEAIQQLVEQVAGGGAPGGQPVPAGQVQEVTT